jgi:hypothetical protein
MGLIMTRNLLIIVATIALASCDPGLHVDAVVESQVKDISDQYGKKPDRILRPDGFIVQALWNLDNGNVLTLGNLGILDLQNQSVVTEGQKAVDRNAIAANPTPRF